MRAFTAAALALTLLLGVTAADATTHKKHRRHQSVQTDQKSPAHAAKPMPKEKAPATR